MQASELAESPAAGPARLSPSIGALATPAGASVLAVGVLTAIGVTLRLTAARQSLFADELSTYWISATHGLGGVLSLLYGSGRIAHAEITPPLSFLASWLTTRPGDSFELLRLPSLIAGTITIPLVYLVGMRTVGRRGALVATAFTAVSPFMVFYSSEARAYALMMVLVVGATVSMLLALDTGRARWWVLYAISSCAAFYSHYTSAFVLGAQLLWVLWTAPHARRAAVLANVAAAAGVIPWLPGLINDLNSPTLKILSALSPLTLHSVRFDIGHWAIGYPSTIAVGLTAVPGVLSLVLLAGAAILAGGALALRVVADGALARGIDKRIWLVIVLGCAAPVGTIVLSALGDHVLDVRNLASSWPYLALACSAALAAAGQRLGVVAAALAVVALGLGAAKLLSPRFGRPEYQQAADFIARQARPGDVVINETGTLSPGPLTGLDVALQRRLPVMRAQVPAERGHPFGFLDPIVPLHQAIRNAVGRARGHRVFLVTTQFANNIPGLEARVTPPPGRFPEGYRLVASQRYTGIGGTLVAVYAHVAPPSK
jgi:mannosyltransferase